MKKHTQNHLPYHSNIAQYLYRDYCRACEEFMKRSEFPSKRQIVEYTLTHNRPPYFCSIRSALYHVRHLLNLPPYDTNDKSSANTSSTDKSDRNDSNDTANTTDTTQ